jgi:hypothetical protein
MYYFVFHVAASLRGQIIWAGDGEKVTKRRGKQQVTREASSTLRSFEKLRDTCSFSRLRS